MAPAERAGPEDEKITLNIGPVDLGRIDLLVHEGVYSSRTDAIRTAIRRQLDDHEKLVDDVVTRKELQVGFLSHSKSDLERLRDKGEKLRVKVVGVYKLGDGVTKKLVSDVLDEVTVLGSLRGPKDVVEWIKQWGKESE
jgi:Arc/MetJ-type ribon-helix-helix transcriptional regulator